MTTLGLSRHTTRVSTRPRRQGRFHRLYRIFPRSAYGYDAIVHSAKLVVDTRNATRRVKQSRDKIVNC